MLIYNSILNGPYVRRMIHEQGDANRDVNVTETFHEQTDDELSEKDLKPIEADDQAIQTILLVLPEDIYAAVDSCETAQEIWLRISHQNAVCIDFLNFIKICCSFHQIKIFSLELDSCLFLLRNQQLSLKISSIPSPWPDRVVSSKMTTKIASLQNELQRNIYKNAKLRTQLFKRVSDQKDNTHDSSKNTKFEKQLNVEILPKIGETNALSNPVTFNFVSTPQVSKGVNNAKVIAPEMFRISPVKISWEAKTVPNTVSASSRIKPITVSQPNVITKKNVNSDLNGLSSTGVDNTKTRRPQLRSNTKNDRVPSVSKSSRSKNKEANVEEHHRNLLLSKKNEHMSSACNNFKLDSQDVISKVVCAKCKKCLIFVNHDKCVRNYVNGKNSRRKKQKAKANLLLPVTPRVMLTALM
nr:hypothetical protein [Tanacetum cinerariifolium]